MSGVPLDRAAGAKSGLSTALESQSNQGGYQPRVAGRPVELPKIDRLPEPFRVDDHTAANSAGLRKVLEFRDKVRELEVGLIDTKSSLNSQMTLISEQISQKIESKMAALEQRLSAS